ncbi:MAG TPA: hypothetical protein PLP16_12740 [Smithellaceae bacterium]|jgi:hypothetical protein|nr:hypothetical protein [Smithellaceae bacterium]
MFGKLDENESQFNDLIEIIEHSGQKQVPDNFTPRLMARLADDQKLNILQLLRLTFAQAGNISWVNFVIKEKQEANVSLYFLIAGFFFFFVGSILFSSVLYMAYMPRAFGFILLQSGLILVAAVALIMGGMMMATDVPENEDWAKKIIIFYEFLMTCTSVLIASAIKTNAGGLLAITFGVAAISTGIVLMKILECRSQVNNETLTGELHNA